jgi:hypothetical protein
MARKLSALSSPGSIRRLPRTITLRRRHSSRRRRMAIPWLNSRCVARLKPPIWAETQRRLSRDREVGVMVSKWSTSGVILGCCVLFAGCYPLAEGNCVDSIQTGGEARRIYHDFFQSGSWRSIQVLDQTLRLADLPRTVENRAKALEAIGGNCLQCPIGISPDGASEPGWGGRGSWRGINMHFVIRCSRAVELDTFYRD